MFITQAGIPAGYGYFTETSVVNQNIVPAMIEYFKSFENFAPISIGTMVIQVKADAQVSINGRAPVLVTSERDFIFDARGVNSIVFNTAVQFNIYCSY